MSGRHVVAAKQAQFETAFPQNSPVGDDGEIDSSTYELLELALSACQPSDSQ
ncbi:MAG: hypothetical protein OXF50_17340 [Caldilineaceae bacterium]|nr:hypothetical protein [Caldilineaceae bacterium]